MYKRKLKPGELFLLLANLIPLAGVWFDHWDAMQVFLVYCLETIVAGVCNLLKMWAITLFRKKDVWTSSGGQSSMVSGYFFMFFFLVHYGFFVSLQISLFLTASGAEKILHVSNAADFIFHFQRYLPANSQWLLLAFAVSYLGMLVKDFLLSGEYKTASLGAVMFAPYGRIFIQQFTVIAGSLFLAFGAGKIFITVFALVKIYFDVFFNYSRLIELIARKEALERDRQ